VTAVVAGDVIRWEQQIRFRHMPTRQYLCITSDRRVTLTPDSKDPRTVFRLHPVIKVRMFSLRYFLLGDLWWPLCNLALTFGFLLHFRRIHFGIGSFGSQSTYFSPF